MRLPIYAILVLLLFACKNNSKRQVVFTSENSQSKEITAMLTNGKILSTIDYKFQGCFGGGYCQLKIIEADGRKKALLIDNGITYQASLNSDKLKAIDTFIEQLKNKKFGFGCTTTAYYQVTIGMEKIENKDGGCDWDGFQNLRDALFPSLTTTNKES